MFEREIQRAKELLTGRLAAAQQFVYWQEIRERADIPVFYRNFFGAEVQWWIFEEQLQRAANPRFDYAHEQLALHTVEADRCRMEAARFDHQDLTSAIDLAVKTRFNYILRPRTTLKWFVYRGEPTKTLSEVMLRMDYFLEYDYLLDGFRKWIAAKQSEVPTKQPVRQVSLVSVVEFDRTLQGVDNDVILDYSPEEFTDLLSPIFEMFDEIHATDRALQQYRGKVPMPAIIIFLDDKGIYRIAQELEEMMKTRSLRYIGQREFLHLLNDIVNKLEHETPLPTSLHNDPVTLPITFDDEPIIKADDTIGELAIGTAKRKPKLTPVQDSSLSAEPIFEPSNTPMTEEFATTQHSETTTATSSLPPTAHINSDHAHFDDTNSSKIDSAATDEDNAFHVELAAAEREYEEQTQHSAAFGQSLQMNTDELPQTFGTELAGLAAMMQEFQAPEGTTSISNETAGYNETARPTDVPDDDGNSSPMLQASFQASHVQAEIHDAEYVMIPAETPPESSRREAETQNESSVQSSPVHREGASTHESAIANTIQSAPVSASQRAEAIAPTANPISSKEGAGEQEDQPKSSLFARWSSIFSSRNEE